jgi:hypothetical protein
MRNCVVCGTVMDPVLTTPNHPSCIMFAEPGDEDSFTNLIKSTLTDIITEHDRRSPRSIQVKIGPSEMGDLCDRKVAYRLANIPPCNEPDNWPAIVGTACHSWLEGAVTQSTRAEEFITEKTLHIEQFVEGHSDLYWYTQQLVIDWKTMGPDKIRKTRKEGPEPGYVVQAHLYGYGFEQAGLPVKRVALACLPRAGWLRDMYVWWAEYDRSIAEAALNRMFGLARQILDLDVLKESHGYRWEQIPAVPSNNCGLCPYYDPGRPQEFGATETGCPGR